MVAKRVRDWERHLLSSTKLSQIKASAMVVYMDDDIIALNKPPGLPVHDGPGLKPGSSLTSNMGLWQFDGDTPPSLAHRIDKNTSGVILLSRNVKSARKMARLFSERKITKRYCALCVGIPDEQQGSIQIPLGVKNISTVKQQKSMHRVVLRPDRIDRFNQSDPGTILPGNVQLAWTNFSVISQVNHVSSLLCVTPVTGFRHQIRVHLADGLLCPVVGDYKFAGPLFRLNKGLGKKMASIGSTKGFTRGPMYLHAYQVEIPSESEDNNEKPLVINAPLPDHFIRTIRSLGFHLPRDYHRLLFT